MAKQATGSASFRYEVRTPVKTFSGVRAGIHFGAGVGYTNSPDTATECHQLGYEVTDLETGRKLGENEKRD